DAPFSLTEAQSIVAREQGFEGWAALKVGLIEPARPSKPAAARATPEPRLKLLETTLFVTDLAATCRFFDDVLGFSTVCTYGEPAFFGQVARDGVPLNLRCVDVPVFVGDIRAREDLYAAQIGVSNVKALYAEFKAKGAAFHQPLKKHPWGGQDFVIRDLDGN